MQRIYAMITDGDTCFGWKVI